MSTQKKPDSKNWTPLKKTTPELVKGFSVDLKKHNQYEIVLVRKKEFLFSF